MHYSQSPPLAEALDLDATSDQRTGRRPGRPSIHSPRFSGRRDDRVLSERPSAGRRILRTLTRFVIAVLIGVGATLAWQSYGDEARKMMVAGAPTLAWMLSVSTAKSPALAATPPEPAQQLAPLASNLDAVRRSMEQLAFRQDQMAQNIATMQAVEEDIRQKMSATPPPPSPQAAPMAQSRTTQPRAQSSAVQPSTVPRATSPGGPLPLSR
jgi:hypothetical protein